MSIINEDDKDDLAKLLSTMVDPVVLVVFSREDCSLCPETLQICKELAKLGKKLSVEHYNLEKNTKEAKRYAVDKAPAIVVQGPKGNGIRFYGVPAGFEFKSLVEDILDASKGSTSLSQTTRDALVSLDRDVRIEVFVTPTCPHCPGMVRLAHMFAVESPHVKADAVQSAEFPGLAMHYRIMGVPSVVVNGSKSFEGLQPESVLLKKIMEI